MRALIRIVAAGVVLVIFPCRLAHAQQRQFSAGERVVVCLITLEHADAEQLASALKPFLSPLGRLTAYAPTNTLIIRDRISIVNMLAEVIKGQPCTPLEQPPQGENGGGPDLQAP